MPYEITTGATAIVSLTVEVESGSSWGPETTLDQVYKQAKEGALGHLSLVLKNSGRSRIVGEPEVKSIITTRRRE